MRLLATAVLVLFLSGCVSVQFNYYKTVEKAASTQDERVKLIARTRADAEVTP